MSDLRQRREPIRSNKIRNAAKGEECTLRIFLCCVGGTDTTVLAHLHDGSQGMAQKADDLSAVFACRGCHDEIDGRSRKTKGADLTRYKLEGLQRTIRRLYERGLIIVPITIETPASERPIKPRKPRDQRAKIGGPGFSPNTRKIPSRPMRAKEPS